MGDRDFNEKLGAAIERAASELPEGYSLCLDIEQGAGTVSLLLPDTDAVLEDFYGDTFVDQINRATDCAVARAAGDE